jgi:hypothetical protein
MPLFGSAAADLGRWATITASIMMTNSSMKVRPVSSPARPTTTPAPCLNCGASLVGTYCAECGQRAVDVTAPTWHVVKEALQDATDLDGRALRTLKALGSPGQLTIDFLRGRRVVYFSPLKLFLVAGTILSATWIATRGVDAHYYGIPADRSAAAYIDAVIRGYMATGIAITASSWIFGRGRRRLLDEAVFALHLVAALALFVAGVVWVGTAWKLVWGTAAAAPRNVPSLPLLLFAPAAIAGVVYLVAAVRRVYRGRWWTTGFRALLITAITLAAVTEFVAHVA